MIYLGLTGNIACGKSSVAALFEKLGCYSIDADELSRKVMSKGEKAYEQIVEAFGESVLKENGELDRPLIKRIVFNDETERKTLESIVHPAILEAEQKLAGEIKGKDNKAIIITQAALSVEAGTYKRFDTLIVVYADEKCQLERLLKRDGINRDIAEKMIASQMHYEEKVKFADFIIDNSGSLESLENEVNRVYSDIKQLIHAKKQLKKSGISDFFNQK